MSKRRSDNSSLAPFAFVAEHAIISDAEFSVEYHQPIRVFYSYSAADDKFREQLERHLALLQRDGVIEPWHFRKLTPGADWRDEIDKNLEAAELILLLVSDSFLASNYCYDVELARALQKHLTGQAIVVPIILTDCDWKHANFADFQALPPNGKPVTSWKPKARAWKLVVDGIRDAIGHLKRRDSHDVAGYLREGERAKKPSSRKHLLATVTVPANNAAGTTVDIDIQAGDHIEITAAGVVTCDGGKHFHLPDGMLCTRDGIVLANEELNAPMIWLSERARYAAGMYPRIIGALIAWEGKRYRRELAFNTGDVIEAYFKKPCRSLTFLVNDNRGDYHNNDGAFEVTIRRLIGGKRRDTRGPHSSPTPVSRRRKRRRLTLV